MKKINLILGIISILFGLSIFLVSYINYQNIVNFYNKSEKVMGYVYNVRKIKDETYSFEYKYVADKTELKSYVSEYKIEKLKDNDEIEVYYNKDKTSENIIKKPNIKSIIPGLVFLIILTSIGIINIFKYFKSSRA